MPCRSSLHAQSNTALIIVDIQNDFCAGGSMEVPGSQQIIQQINTLRARHSFDYVVLTLDNHPSTHVSFAANHASQSEFTKILLSNGIQQELWPIHCVANSFGQELHTELVTESSDTIIHKGQLESIDSYSGFGSNGENTGLADFLRLRDVSLVYICGLAFDYCVGLTALDSARHGFQTVVVSDASASISDDTAKVMTKRFNEFKGMISLATTREIIHS